MTREAPCGPVHAHAARELEEREEPLEVAEGLVEGRPHADDGFRRSFEVHGEQVQHALLESENLAARGVTGRSEVLGPHARKQGAGSLEHALRAVHLLPKHR